MLQKYKRVSRKPDFVIAILAVALACFGIIMIASASSVIAYDAFKGANNNYYVFKQILYCVIGVGSMIAFSSIDYRSWKKIAFPMMVVTLLLLVAVFLPGIGREAKGAHRWIYIPFSIQPSEIAKITFTIYLASWLESREKFLDKIEASLIPFALILGVISVLIINQPDLGTLTVILSTAVILFFTAGAPRWQIFSFIGLLAGAFVLFITTESYRWSRFLTFLNPESESLGRSYHVNQLFLAVGAGGFWGLGFSNSLQKLKYLPEPHTDSIFAIICEELGYFRSSIIVLAFVYLFIRAMRIARGAPDTFGRLLAVGIASSLVIQAFINVAAVLGLVPLTGITLPFISSGGTSLIISFIQIGILLSISRYSTDE